MTPAEQIKTASETIALLQDYIELTRVSGKLKCETTKESVAQNICSILETAAHNVTEVL